MKQPDFAAGLFAKNPHDEHYSVLDHIANGDYLTRYVSTTTLFEWTLWCAAKQYVMSGYTENRFIVEIDVAKLAACGHVRFHNRRHARQHTRSYGPMVAKFAISAQEVCIEAVKGKETLPVVPRNCIRAVYRLPVGTDAHGFDRRYQFGHDGNRRVHLLDLKHPAARREFVAAQISVSYTHLTLPTKRIV